MNRGIVPGVLGVEGGTEEIWGTVVEGGEAIECLVGEQKVPLVEGNFELGGEEGV